MKTKLAQGKIVKGTWINAPHLAVTEVLADVGLDFLVYDMEHSVIELSDLPPLFAAAHAKKTTVIVRIGEHSPNLIKRILDAGADGILAAMINTRQEAQALVSSAKYPPMGTRGVGLTRAQGYGFGFADYVKRINRDSIVLALIEHHEAIGNLEDILSVKGLDGTFIGPYDLSGSLGFPGQFDKPEVKKKIAEYEAICRRLKKPMGFHIVHPDEKRFAELKRRGFKLFGIGTDTILLGERARAVFGKDRK